MLIEILKTGEKAAEIAPVPYAKGIVGVALALAEAVYVSDSAMAYLEHYSQRSGREGQ